MNGPPADTCPGCGAAIANGEGGCQALFEVLQARDFNDPLFFGTHRMVVDTYALQHPDRYCASAKSFAAHFVSLCLILEKGSSQAVGDESVQRWLNGNRELQKPQVPTFRGIVTIADVTGSSSPSDYKAAVRRWAASTWSAYASLHPLARAWALEALASRPSRRRK